MNRKYKAEIKSVDERGNLPISKELIMNGPYEAEDTVREMLNNGGCEKVDVKVSLYDEEFDEWYVHSEITHCGSNARPNEFMLVYEGAHVRRLAHSWCEERIFHVRSKIVLTVNDASVNYDDELRENPEVLFYRFKYTTELGKVYRFTLYCPLIGYGYSPERLAEIKETILKPGARWYCDHFREKFRAYRDEDALSRWHKRRDEENK